jgi:hypothetical protein
MRLRARQPFGADLPATADGPSVYIRGALAIAVSVAAMFICHGILEGRHVLAADFTWPWRAARILLAGQDPYKVIQPTGAYPFDDHFLYPLPAALASLPFASLRPILAGTAFVGLSAALMTFAITREGYHWLPLLVSAPFIKVLLAPQWSPLLVAAALIPGLQFLAVTKPNLGIAALVYNPTWRGVVGCAVFLLVSLVVLPTWPWEWRSIVAQLHTHKAPYRMFLGPLLLLSIVRYRTREGRLLFAMALLPQRLLLYDQLVLWLIPRRWWSSLLLSILSWPALAAWMFPSLFGVPKGSTWALTERMTMVCIYLPVLCMVLIRKNDGDLPPRLEQALNWLMERVGRRGVVGGETHGAIGSSSAETAQ